MENHSKAIALAINYINQVMDTECIYYYGTRISTSQTASIFTATAKTAEESVHFDLLVITSDECTVPDFIGQLEDISDINLTVSLITHTHSAVQQALKENNRFFHSVLTKGTLVDSKAGKVPVKLTTEFNREADDKITLDYWKGCCKDALTYSEHVINGGINDHVAIALLKKSMEQVCLGLIYVFMGYQPEGYELDELLELCNSMDPRFGELVPIVTEKNKFNYRILIDGFWNGEYGEGKEPDITWIHSCCDEFVSYAKELCNLKLQLVKQVQ